MTKEADVMRGMSDCERHGYSKGCTPDCPVLGSQEECPDFSVPTKDLPEVIQPSEMPAWFEKLGSLTKNRQFP